MQSTTKRIEYIDLAKGMCILLVVLSHMMAYYKVSFPYDSVLKCFRMPLYFFLSGVFFKQYEGFWGFFKRKVNKLLIPFAFFYLAFGVALPIVLYNHCGIKMQIFNPKLGIGESLLQIGAENFPNAAIWFLLCLFDVNIFFYIIYIIAKRFGTCSTAVVIALSAAAGVAGMTLSYFRCNLPLYIDTALTAVPFFACGYLLNRKSGALRYGWKYDRYLWWAVAACIGVLMLLAYPLDYRSNYFANCYFTAHICGMAGTMMTLFIAKKLRHVPVVTYWGRYSIMILCTHQVLYQLLNIALKQYVPFGWSRLAVNMAIVMMLYFLIIPFMRRCMPHVTAQKDVLRV